MIDVDDSILGDVAKGFNIPPKPRLLQLLQDELSNEEPDLTVISNIVSQDIACSAAVMKVINSPFYGLSRTISDIKQAVMFLGIESISALVTGFLLKQSFDQKDSCISLERFWDTATEIANVAVLIGQKTKSKLPTEIAYTLGLFHDCGIPLMAQKYPEYKLLLEESNSDYHISLVEREEESFKTNHVVMGYYLSNSWRLPKNICQIILRHHELNVLNSELEEEDKIAYAVLKIAENLVHTSKRFVAAPDWPYVKEIVLDILEMDEDDYNDIREDVEQLI